MTPNIKADIDRQRSIKHNANKKARRENARNKIHGSGDNR